MRGRWNSIFVCAVFVAAASMAQQTNTSVETPGGTVGTIPEFWGNATIGDSVITQNQRRIGIGTKNTTFFDPLIVQSSSGSGGGIGMIGMALPGASDYAWAESDYLLNNPAATNGPVNLWGIGAEGLFSALGQVSNQDMYIVNAANPPIQLCRGCCRQCLHRRFGFFDQRNHACVFCGGRWQRRAGDGSTRRQA